MFEELCFCPSSEKNSLTSQLWFILSPWLEEQFDFLDKSLSCSTLSSSLMRGVFESNFVEKLVLGYCLINFDRVSMNSTFNVVQPCKPLQETNVNHHLYFYCRFSKLMYYSVLFGLSGAITGYIVCKCCKKCTCDCSHCAACVDRMPWWHCTQYDIITQLASNVHQFIKYMGLKWLLLSTSPHP